MNIVSLLTSLDKKAINIQQSQQMSPNTRSPVHTESIIVLQNSTNNIESNNILPQNLLKFSPYSYQQTNFHNNTSQRPLSPNKNNYNINNVNVSKLLENFESPVLTLSSTQSSPSISPPGQSSPHNINNSGNFTQLKSPTKSNKFYNNLPINNSNINIPPLHLQNLPNIQPQSNSIKYSQLSPNSIYNENLNLSPLNSSPNRSSSPNSNSPNLSPTQMRFKNNNGYNKYNNNNSENNGNNGNYNNNNSNNNNNYNNNYEDNNNNYNKNEKIKKRRTRLKKEQTRILKEFFDKEEYPTKEDKERLSSILKMSYNTVTTWFSNKRQDKKRKTTDIGGRRVPVGGNGNSQDDDYDDMESSDDNNYNGCNNNNNKSTELTPILNGVNFNSKKYHPYSSPKVNSPNHGSPRSSSNNTPLKNSNNSNGNIPPLYLQSKINNSKISKQHNSDDDDEFEIDEGIGRVHTDSDLSDRSSPNQIPHNYPSSTSSSSLNNMNSNILLSDDDHFADGDENNSISTLNSLSKSNRLSDEELDNKNNNPHPTESEFVTGQMKVLNKKYKILN